MVIAAIRSTEPYRRGTTLLEVLLASVILAAALATLTQQSFVGAQAARRTELESEAAVRCQSQLSLLVSQRNSLQENQSGSWPDAANWQWTAAYVPSEVPDVRKLTVTVWQPGPVQHLATCTLVRLLTNDGIRTATEVNSRVGTLP